MLDYTFRVYVTDCFYLQAQEKMFTERWCDLVDPTRAEAEKKSGEEIAMEVMERAGLKFGGE